MTLVFSAVIAVIAIGSARDRYPEAETSAIVLGVILVGSAAVALVTYVKRGNELRFVWAIGIGMAVFVIWLVSVVMPFVTARTSTKDIVGRVPSNLRANVVELSLNRPSLLFYLGCQPKHLVDVSEARSLLSKPEPMLVICRETDEARVIVPGSSELARSGGLGRLADKVASMRGMRTK